MKKATYLLAAYCVLAACTAKETSDASRCFRYEGTTDTLGISLSVELPCGGDAVSVSVRSSLLDVLYKDIDCIGYGLDPVGIKPFDYASSNPEDAVCYYGKTAREKISSIASESETQIPWELSCSLSRVRSTDKYWVFLSQDYVYMGGAHGGVSGAGYLTFNRSDGSLLTEIIDRSKVAALQPVLRRGLLEYFRDDCGEKEVTPQNLDEYLLLGGEDIPLPVWEPYPGEDGLTFTYQQYEVAPYAAGMPAFTVSYEEIGKFLSPAAASLLLSSL